ncbi:eukaryotic aspartyl protease (macronuclear) [Tetrahymena thermophila SB210]|uniref:Eukaryotic aspartyl protease n=1 Tax=Tetrahymena thermophila (strain SB210) TaxID=312017 RepID=I7MG58_TETTS|nr:eukaryotic aspartyl protease [Tetrahymena thermophila SB210]EAR84880.3 eukaryotic aspartyl protease [Tetrahymena thermophila SB210]|eukprot:XP_001032543.3 eukaryotic aspartyl protease [Tetrahymena thermophila SB210]
MNKVISLILLILTCSHVSFALIKVSIIREYKPHQKYERFLSSDANVQASQSNKVVSLENYFQMKYFGTIYVGKNQQKMKMLFDSGSDTMWIGSKTCNTCRDSGINNLYDCIETNGCKYTGDPIETIRYLKGQVDGYLASTIVNFSNNNSASPFDFNLLLITNVKDLESYDADGIIGLTYQVSYKRQDTRSPFVKELFQRKIINDQSFSVYLGFKKDDSEITFGGINQDKVNPGSNFIYYLVPPIQAMFWEISVQSLILGSQSYDMSSSTTIVDSGTSVLCFETQTFNNVYEFLKQNVNGLQRKDLYFTYKCGQPLPNIYFTIISADGKKYKYSIESDYYTIKLNGDCAILIDLCPNNNILGEVFMRKYVTHFKYNYKDNKDAIGFALSIADPKDNYLNDSENQDYTKYYILGGVGAGVIILIVIVIYYFRRRKIKQNMMKQNEQLYQKNVNNTDISSKS